MLLNGIGRKDVVALFLDNRPHFAALLIALAKIGCRAVLVNVNMRDMVLTHCINQSEATAMVFGSEKTEQVMAIQDALVAKGILKLFSLGPSLPLLPYAGISASSAPYVSNDSPLVIISDVNSIRRASPEHVPAELRAGLSVHDHFCYIYTSGTTGLPSMARLSHLRAYRKNPNTERERDLLIYLIYFVQMRRFTFKRSLASSRRTSSTPPCRCTILQA